MSDTKQKKHNIKIEIDDNIGQGEYVNFAVVTHSIAEFIMDFVRVLPGIPKSKVKSRIVISPIHAKTFMLALQDNIKKFENKYGEIKIGNKASNQFNISKDSLPN
tara:strand:- start:1536 stop:1850 length:315 start_codon:yes stop_codon:yes gene_type:complete